MICEFCSFSTNILCGLSAYKPLKLVAFCLNMAFLFIFSLQHTVMNCLSLLGEAKGCCSCKNEFKPRYSISSQENNQARTNLSVASSEWNHWECSSLRFIPSFKSPTSMYSPGWIRSGTVRVVTVVLAKNTEQWLQPGHKPGLIILIFCVLVLPGFRKDLLLHYPPVVHVRLLVLVMCKNFSRD